MRWLSTGGADVRDFDWEIIDELHRNPNVSRAAAALYMTQPTLTKRLQHIERELGVRIAERTPKGLAFTPEGEYLAKRAAEHKEFVEQTHRGLEELRQTASKMITVGSSYTFNKYNLWDVLGGYAEAGDPEVRFTVVNDQSDALFRMVLDGKLDLAFVRGDYEGPVRRTLVDCNQAYLMSREPVDIDDLPTLPRIDFRTNAQSTELLERWWLERYGSKMVPGMSVGYIDFVWELVAQGRGYALCFVSSKFENERGLCLTPLTWADGSPLVRRTWCVCPKAALPAHVESFIRYVRDDVAISEGAVLRPAIPE